MPTQKHYDDWEYHVEDNLGGIEPYTEIEVSDGKREQGLDYVSKSRIKTYKENAYEFFLKYWCEHRPPGTYYTERGSQIHLAFELFHENLMEYVSVTGSAPDRFTELMPDDYALTSQWLDFIGSFWEFELRRLSETRRTFGHAERRLPQVFSDSHIAKTWVPRDVEAEFWMGEPPSDYGGDPDYIDPNGPPVGDIPWMGKADVVLNSASVPGVTGGGVTIVDYKTGSCPTIKYEGAPFLEEILDELFLQTEYYGWMAEHVYDTIDAVAIYYPGDDELLVGEYNVKERRYQIKSAALGLQEQPGPRNADGVPVNFPHEDTNLTHYGDGCSYWYNILPSDAGEN